MTDLYRENTLERFWRLPQPVPMTAWLPAAQSLLASIPGATQPDVADWNGLTEYVLGEGQFGPARYQLSMPKRAYYALRPLVPRSFTSVLRRGYHGMQSQTTFRLSWPTEERYARFCYAAMAAVLAASASETLKAGALPPANTALRSRLWPDGAAFAFVLTHDVERADGRDFVRKLADVDERHGFRSSFNFVPEAYPADEALLRDLRDRGFEVGVHGLVHDGRLFSSRATFEQRARRINAYLHSWNAVGFRSPLTHRNPEWMQALEVEYDLSCFDTDPYEPMPGGTMSLWPFFCGNYVELPYTLPQDHTLLVVRGERTPRLWIEKLDAIIRWGGMALVNVHPDYMREPAHLAVYEAFLQHAAVQRAAHGGWHALPRAVARWWRERQPLGIDSCSLSLLPEGDQQLLDSVSTECDLAGSTMAQPTRHLV